MSEARITHHRRFIGFSKAWQRIIAWRSNLAAICLAVMAVLFFLVSYLIRLPWTTDFDYRQMLWMQSFASPQLTFIAAGFTFLAQTPTLILFGIVACLGLLILRRPWAALLVVIAVLGIPLNYLIKFGFDRPRPDISIVEVFRPTFGSSYPSGHAMAATMFYGALALLAWIHAPTPKLRFLGVTGFACTALMVCASRIYLGAHFLSDVLGGMAAGMFCLTILALTYKKLNGKVKVNA